MTEPEPKHICPKCQFEFKANPGDNGRILTCNQCGFLFKSPIEVAFQGDAGEESQVYAELRTMNGHLSRIRFYTGSLFAIAVFFLALMILQVILSMMSIR